MLSHVSSWLPERDVGRKDQRRVDAVGLALRLRKLGREAPLQDFACLNLRYLWLVGSIAKAGNRIASA